MPRPKGVPKRSVIPASGTAPPDGRPDARRNGKGQWRKGVSGNITGNPGLARRALNLATIEAMSEAFKKGGKAAVDKVLRQQPAVFLKLLVLLVPRELEVTQTGGVKAMSDDQLEAAILAIEGLLAKRGAGENAKIVEASPLAIPGPDVGRVVGTDGKAPD